jgi:putative endonuclease
MSYFTYVILSENENIYYKGFTEDIRSRISDHNSNKSRYTSGKGPWKLLVLEEHPDKRTALIREKALKKCKSDYFIWLSKQESNLAANYPDLR